MLTGTIVVTEASRPVPKKKSMAVTSTTNSTLTKSSFANTQDTTKTQPKLKSINSMLFSENKLRSGSIFKKTNFTVKSNVSTKESRAALLNGNCVPNKWSTRSKLTGKLAWLQESQNFQSSLLVFMVNVLTIVLVLKRD